jgi:hypothetical protein
MGKFKGDWDSKDYAFHSGLTVKRWVPPASPREAKVMTQFVQDYTNQGNYVPNGMISASTQLQKNRYHTMNKSGKSACLGPIATSQMDRMGDQPGKF